MIGGSASAQFDYIAFDVVPGGTPSTTTTAAPTTTTTAAPTTTTTAGGGPDPSCTDGTAVPYVPSNAQAGVAEGPYYVTDDTWNVGGLSGNSQTIHVCNYNNWYVNATYEDNNTGVKAYPNVQETFSGSTPLSGYTSIGSTYGDTPPTSGAGDDYEFAYDMWTDNYTTEVMIWTYNDGQTPGGTNTGQTLTDGGVTYDIYHSGTYPSTQYIAFVPPALVGAHGAGSTAGTMNIGDFYNKVISEGWDPASAVLNQIDYGVELCETDSAPLNFIFNAFSIAAAK
jgi:hypothetical protein